MHPQPIGVDGAAVTTPERYVRPEVANALATFKSGFKR